MLKYQVVTYSTTDGGVIDRSPAYFDRGTAVRLCGSNNRIAALEGKREVSQVKAVKVKPVQTYRGNNCVGYRSC